MRHHQQAAIVERRDDWSSLIARTAERDEAAFTELYDRSCALVNGLVLRILRDPAVTEEVVLDVYLQIWRQAERYEPARGSVRAWLLLLARSRAIDHLRSSNAEPREREPLERAHGVAAVDPSPEDHAMIEQRRSLVARACASLTASQRQVVELAYFAGLSHSEIAERLGQPLGTVKTRLRASMKFLRETLTKSGAPAW